MQKNIPDISKLSDAELRGIVSQISNAVGVSPDRLGSIGTDMKKLRSTVSSIGDDELRRLIDRAGKDKAEQIYKALNGGK